MRLIKSHSFSILFILLFYFGHINSANADLKNAAVDGQAFVWYGNTYEFADSNKRAEDELNDENIDSVIWLNENGIATDGDIENAWEAAGIIWGAERSDIVKFVYTHGPFDGGTLSDGAFTKNFHIQVTRDGLIWENIDIQPNPEYVYFTNEYDNEGSEVSNEDFVFEGDFGMVRGIRVLGQVRTDNGEWWGSYVSTCRQVWAYKTVGPHLTRQPLPQIKKEGETAEFIVQAAGADTVIYRWYRNGEIITGADDSVYITPKLSIENNGDLYYCIVSDSTGSATSDTASLTIYSGNDLLLAKDGVFYYQIYYAQNENHIIEYAAEELKDYLEDITNSNISLTNDPTSSDKLIVIGLNNPLTQNNLAELAIDSVKYDGFHIKSIGDTLFITGAIERGTLYGVYHFLDNYLGVRWYAADFKIVPSIDLLLLNVVDNLQNPAFKHREVFSHDTDNGFYRQHNRLNGNRMHRSYNYYPPSINTWSLYAPEGGHNFNSVVSSEYHSGGQILAMSSGCRSEAAAYFINKIDNKGAEYWWGFSQNDNGWSPDAASRSFAGAHGGALSAPIVDMVSDVAQKVRQTYADAKLATLAYQWSFEPPTDMLIPDYVMIEIAPIEADFGYPFTDSRNDNIEKSINGWNAIAENVIIWDYRANFQNYIQPLPNIFSMCEDIQYLAGLENVKGYFQEGSYNTLGGEFTELRAWLASRLTWSPNQNYRVLIDEFLNGYYGPAAEYIRQYIYLLDQSFKNSGERISSKQRITSEYLNLDFIQQADNLLAAADAAAGAQYSKQVHKVRMGVDMTILLREHMYKAHAEEEGKNWVHDPNRRTRFEQYATEAGVTEYNEGSSIENLYAAMDIQRINPSPPDIITGQEEWIDFQDLDFRICCGAELVQDNEASDHGAVKKPSDEVWSIQMGLDLLPPEKEWNLYAYVKVDPKLNGNQQGIALNMGIWPGPEWNIKLSELNDGKYHMIEFSGNPYKYETGKYIWFSGGPEAISNYVDRIIAVNLATPVSERGNKLYTFDLKQNYPNPFNPQTKIIYSIPEACRVKLAVYNTLGQKVADLLDDFKQAGSYELQFKDKSLPSGVYFYRIEAVGNKKYVKTEKMILLK